jgi:hypothetical protein
VESGALGKPMKIKYVLAGESFATKKALTERVRSILHNVRGEVRGQDFALLAALVSWHPTPHAKRVDEISELRITPLSGGAGRLDVVRSDGTTCDVSYKKCIDNFTGLDTKPLSIKQAMRWAIQDQVEAFRSSQPPEIAYMPGMEVDHKYPWTFSRLVADFCAAEGIRIRDIELIGQPGWASELDEPLATRWREYHRQHAKLRLLPKELNSRYVNRNPEKIGRTQEEPRPHSKRMPGVRHVRPPQRQRHSLRPRER